MKYFFVIVLTLLLNALPAFCQNESPAKPFYIDDKIDAEIAEVTKAIALEPNNPQLYLKRAHLHRLKWDAPAVSSDVNKALGISPNDISIQFTAVRLLYELPGRGEEALAIINSTIADNPKNDEALASRSRVRNGLGDVVGALDDINTAIALNPKIDIYKSNQAFLMQRLAQTENAVENFTKLLASLEQRLKTETDKQEIEKLKRELMMTYFSRSRVFAQTRDFDPMFADLNRAVEIYPIPYAYQTRARAYVWQKMYAEAIADLTKAIELKDNDAVSWMDRGDVYFRLEKFPEAIADYEQVLKLNRGMERRAESQILEAKKKIQENTKNK